MTEAETTSDTSVNIYHITRCNIQDDQNSFVVKSHGRLDHLTSRHTKSSKRMLRTFQESVPCCREAGNHTVAVKKLHREVNYCKMQVF